MPINTEKLADLVRRTAALAPDGECATGCGQSVLTDYPVCAFHAKKVHFTHRVCICDACVAERAAQVEQMPVAA